jgi:methyl-accepting chemotaxis protein
VDPSERAREDTQAAIELARWQGEMDQRMREGDERFDRMESGIGRIESRVNETREQMSELKTKVALFGALGGLAGSAIVGLIVAIGTRAI